MTQSIPQPEVFSFLLGEGPLEGTHFGEKHPSHQGNFWWRKHLRAALSQPMGVAAIPPGMALVPIEPTPAMEIFVHRQAWKNAIGVCAQPPAVQQDRGEAPAALPMVVNAPIPVVIGPGVLCSVCGLGRHVACHRPLLSGPNAGEPLDHVFTVETVVNGEEKPEGLPFGIIDPDYARIFTKARILAWSYGFACVPHGSFTRDLDLVLVPWEPHATDEAGARVVAMLAQACDLKLRDDDPFLKPHGRRNWTLVLPGFGDPRWVDLSVAPCVVKE